MRESSLQCIIGGEVYIAQNVISRRTDILMQRKQNEKIGLFFVSS